MKMDQSPINDLTNSKSDILEKKIKFNPLAKEFLSTDFSKMEADSFINFLYGEIKESRPVMYEEEIKSLYNKYLEENKKDDKNSRLNFEIGRAVMDYTSDSKKIDSKTKENTLDRSYRVFYEIAENFPEEMHNLSEWTHHLFEFVNPKVFFETYIKIKNSETLNKYFGGGQFSQLEYNMSYCGTEKYISALLEEIDFKNSNSCLKSSQLINLAAYLADYAKNGSYGGNYEIDEKIVEGFKTKMDNPDSIYLLGSKTRFIVSRIEDGLPPFVHNDRIFKLSPNQFGTLKKGELYVSDANSDLDKKIEEYHELKTAVNTPSKELVDEAIRLHRDYVDWEPDKILMMKLFTLEKSISSQMKLLSKDKVSLGSNNINKSQLSEYVGLIGTDYRYFLEEEFNFSFSEMSVSEQFYFLEFIQQQTNESILSVKEFTKKYSKNGFRTFLSIEQGGKEMGDKIISLGEKLPGEVAEKVFQKYGEIIDNVNKITDFTRQNFNKEIETSPELIHKIEETLYTKGKQLLSGIYDDLNSQKEIDFTDISSQLDRINADTITTFAIFKQAVKNGDKLPIESIEGSVFSKKEASNISQEQKNEMSELYDRNYKVHPDREFITKVKEYFNTAFNPESNKSKNYFYTFEKDNKTRAFVRFEKKEDKSLYASALNVDEASKNFGLGEAMMDEALSREAKENILCATCLISNPSNMRYFEKGFISDHFKMVDKTNQFDLIWDEKKNINILAKQKSIEELTSMYLKNSYEGSIEMKKKDNLADLHESIPEGKALVRCFMDPMDNRNWYAVYEKLPEGYGLNISEAE